MSPGVSSKERVRCTLTVTFNRTSHVLQRKTPELCCALRTAELIKVQLIVVLSGTPKNSTDRIMCMSNTGLSINEPQKRAVPCRRSNRHHTCLSRDSIQLFSGRISETRGRFCENRPSGAERALKKRWLCCTCDVYLRCSFRQ